MRPVQIVEVSSLLMMKSAAHVKEKYRMKKTTPVLNAVEESFQALMMYVMTVKGEMKVNNKQI